MNSPALPRPVVDASPVGVPAETRGAFRVDHALQQHGPHLLQLAQNLLGGDSEARDVLVHAFATVARDGAWPGREAEALRAAVVERAVALLRAKPRVRVPASTLAPTFLADGHRSVPVQPAALVHLQVLQGPAGGRRLRQAIVDLPDELRVVLVLRDLERFDEATTATLVGSEVEGVRQRLHLARHAVWELLARSQAS